LLRTALESLEIETSPRAVEPEAPEEPAERVEEALDAGIRKVAG
jgi:hypothetical protein